MPFVWFAAALLGMPPALPDACPAPVTPPAELTGWRTPMTGRADRPLAVGQATQMPLAVDPVFATPPGKPAAAGSRGAAVAFTIAKSGRYRVAIGAPAWIDVVENGKPLASVAHGHGPACSGVGKMVDFTLALGPHTLELSGAAAAATTVMIVPAS